MLKASDIEVRVNKNGTSTSPNALQPLKRIKLLSMRKDRADVIAPAMSLIEELMILFDIHELMLPQVGLKLVQLLLARAALWVSRLHQDAHSADHGTKNDGTEEL